MRNTIIPLSVRLDLFDADAAPAAADDAGSAPGAPGADGGGEVQAKGSGSARRSDPGETGAAAERGGAAEKQPSDAGGEENTPDAGAPGDPEERRRAFLALANGEYKDVYTRETQRIIDRRFRQMKQLQEQLDAQKPVMDLLMQRHHVAEGDMAGLARALENDDALWQQAADEAGLTVEQYRRFARLERENARLRAADEDRRRDEAARARMERWDAEADGVRQHFPGFDLAAEAKDPQFLALLRSGVPMEHAYKVMHMDDIVSDAMRTSAAEAARRVAADVRARGARPAENGAAAGSGFTVKEDVSRLSRQDRAEIARRVARGETISF